MSDSICTPVQSLDQQRLARLLRQERTPLEEGEVCFHTLLQISISTFTTSLIAGFGRFYWRPPNTATFVTGEKMAALGVTYKKSLFGTLK